jgi:hypothetical protein
MNHAFELTEGYPEQCAVCCKPQAAHDLIVRLNPKPIPNFNFDWEAWRDGHEERGMGYGATKEMAIADFLDMEDMRREDAEPEPPAGRDEYDEYGLTRGEFL